MKRLIMFVALFMLLAVANVAVGADSGTYVTYYLPYLHTNADRIVYCVVSNFGIGADNITHVGFTVMGNSTGNTSRSTKFMWSTYVRSNFAYKMTSMISFSGQGIYIGASTDNQHSDLSGIVGTSESYGAKLTFVSTIKAGTNAVRDSHLNCKNISMSCFQGTTSPKRNLVGYSCEAGNTSDPENAGTYMPYNITPANFSGETTADNATGYSY